MTQETEELRRQLSIAQESVKALTSSLAESNAEAEELRRKYSDLQLRMEALGLASANKDRAKLEQRLQRQQFLESVGFRRRDQLLGFPTFELALRDFEKTARPSSRIRLLSRHARH